MSWNMDYIKDMFPFVNVSFIPRTSISEIFTGCLACQPFGKLKKRSESETTVKPSREIKTISSLVEKFNIGYDGKNGHNITTPGYKIRLGNSFYRPCSRQTSFNMEMNHEKFTPCEKQLQINNDNNHINRGWIQESCDSENGGDYGKINYNYRQIPRIDANFKGNVQEKPTVVPPRRKKQPAPRIEWQVSSQGSSMDSNLERENWKNYRNQQLNNLDQPRNNSVKLRNDESNNNIDSRSCKAINNNCSSGGNGNECAIFNYVSNNKFIKNNKSGCSKLAIVNGNSLETNDVQNFSKFDRLSESASKNANIIDNLRADHYENKIYYKNSGFDKFGNYRHGSDSDEVIVCESYTGLEPKAFGQLPKTNIFETLDRPKNSTYTKFYTDGLYKDDVDMMSTKSIDEPFEQIVQLQPDMAPFLQTALAMWRARMMSSSKQEPPPHIQRHHESRQSGSFKRSSTEEDEVSEDADTNPAVFCELLPINQSNAGKLLPPAHVLDQTYGETSPSGNMNNNNNPISSVADSRAESPAEHDNNLTVTDDSNIQDRNVEVVGYVRKNSSFKRKMMRKSQSGSFDGSDTSWQGKRIHVSDQYTGTDKCEL